VIEIRKAEWRDLPGIATLIRMHYDSTGFPQELAFDADVVQSSLIGLLTDPNCILLVVADGESIVGTMGLVITPTFFTAAVGARELFLYIKPEYRGKSAGVGMIRMAEDWARSHGAHVIIIGNHPLSPPHVATTYERHGYREAQTDFIKRL